VKPVLPTSPEHEHPHADARDLVEVARADDALDALDAALRRLHPLLDDRHAFGDPISLRRARTVTRFAAALRGALHAYREVEELQR